MAKIAIVYFSGYGHTEKQAEAVRKGVDAVADAVVAMYRINESGELPLGALEELGQMDAIIYGSPIYMGGPASQFKTFAEAPSDNRGVRQHPLATVFREQRQAARRRRAFLEDGDDAAHDTAVATRKMAEVFTTAASRQFLSTGPFPLNYLRDENSKTPSPIGRVRLADDVLPR